MIILSAQILLLALFGLLIFTTSMLYIKSTKQDRKAHDASSNSEIDTSLTVEAEVIPVRELHSSSTKSSLGNPSKKNHLDNYIENFF